MPDYEYEFRDVPPVVRSRVADLVREGEQLLAENPLGLSPGQGVWMSHVESIIAGLDPHARAMSDSIGERWRTSKWYLRYSSPKTPQEEAVVFGQLVGVARSVTTDQIRVCKPNNEDQFINASTSLFYRRRIRKQDNLVFVLMPFSEGWSDYIWRKQIKPIVEANGGASLVCKRADDLFGPDVMQDTFESIASARIVIAEVTGRNANVFYELGIAHTLGKDVILLAQGAMHIPFDLNRYRHCIYSNDGPGYEILREYLPRSINNLLGFSPQDEEAEEAMDQLRRVEPGNCLPRIKAAFPVPAAWCG